MYNIFEKYMNPTLVALLKEAAIDNLYKQITSTIEKESLANTPVVIPQYVYHLTAKDNLPSILSANALISPLKTIYVCPTLEDVVEFIPFMSKIHGTENVILKIDTSSSVQSNWSISHDHNRKYINAGALIYYSSKLEFSTPPEIISLPL
nr:hypothetical protein [uncultured Niameybacter sp.]